MKYLFLFIFFSVFAFSATVDPSFGTLFHDLYSHIIGNLGKMVSLFGFMVTFIVYMFTHEGSVLAIGTLGSIVIGMIIGFISLFTTVFYDFFMTKTMEGLAVYIMFIIIFLMISGVYFLITHDFFSEKLEIYKKKIKML